MTFLWAYWQSHTRILRRLLMAVWLVSIAFDSYCSLLPDLDLPGAGVWNGDKLYHLVTYCWLGGVAVLAMPGKSSGRIAAAGMIVLGGLLEWGQSLVPPRTASFGDATANTVGVLLGVWLAETALHVRQKAVVEHP